jgi:hypothetical protein
VKDYNLFEELDKALCELAKSDSAIEYASHIRPEFNYVVTELNEVKRVLGFQSKECEKYFK